MIRTSGQEIITELAENYLCRSSMALQIAHTLVNMADLMTIAEKIA